jgi:hypothetical protein
MADAANQQGQQRLGDVSLDFLLQQKQANDEAANRRRSAIDDEADLPLGAGSADLFAKLDGDEDSAPLLSDEDSDLDGGDDSEITEVDVWLGTFEGGPDSVTPSWKSYEEHMYYNWLIKIYSNEYARRRSLHCAACQSQPAGLRGGGFAQSSGGFSLGWRTWRRSGRGRSRG